MFEFVRKKIEKYNKIVEIELKLKLLGVNDSEIKLMKTSAKNYPCSLESYLNLELEKIKTFGSTENIMYKAMSKIIDHELKNEIDKIHGIDTTTSNQQEELTPEKIEQLYQSMKKEKTGIIEILVTKLVQPETIQILHDKYLCMNTDTYEVLKETLNQDCFDTNDLRKKLYLVPIFRGDLADKKYKEYFCKGLKFGVDNIYFIGGLKNNG